MVDLLVNKRVVRSVFWMVGWLTVLAVAACSRGNSSASSGFTPRDQVSIRGQEINVLLPYQIPEPLLADFTRQTGVKVHLDYWLGCGAIQADRRQYGKNLYR